MKIHIVEINGQKFHKIILLSKLSDNLREKSQNITVYSEISFISLRKRILHPEWTVSVYIKKGTGYTIRELDRRKTYE